MNNPHPPRKWYESGVGAKLIMGASIMALAVLFSFIYWLVTGEFPNIKHK